MSKISLAQTVRRTKMDKKLEPCPFCGDKAESDFGFKHNNETYFYVICFKCGGESGHYETEKKAITAWNTRPSPWIKIKEDGSNLPEAKRPCLWADENDGRYRSGYLHEYLDEGWDFTHYQPITLPIPER